MSFRSLICALVTTAAVLALVAPAAMAVTISGDFDNDGFDDLAIGAPREDVGPEGAEILDAGIVHIAYGASAGISGAGHDVFHQGSSGVEEDPGAKDGFGAALATGDFDGDGFDDLAIGVPGEDVTAKAINNAGAVNVLYGSAGGLSAVGDQLRTQQLAAGSGVEPGDRFGSALAALDVRGGSEDDLAIGAPFEDETFFEPDRIDTGAVSIHLGSPTGVASTAGNNYFRSEAIQSGDMFGTALSAGQFGLGTLNFGAPGKQDLVVGAPGSLNTAGRVEIFYLAPTTGFTRQLLTQAQLGITNESGDQFGSVLAVGNFGDGGRDDLAVGTPLENIEAEGATDAGIVGVFYGKGESLSSSGTDVWDQESASLGTIESGDNFGAALTTGDFGRTGDQDLAIGSPREDLATSGGNQADAGFVGVLYGDAGGLAGPGDARLPEPHFNYGPIAGGRLGAALGGGNFASNARDDLAAAAPTFPQGTGFTPSTGLVGVIYGAGTGISVGVTPSNLALFDQDELGDQREGGDRFGEALAPAAGRTTFSLP